MRSLEVRRHLYTKQSSARGRGSHLSQAGVELARAIGSTIGPFAYVATSEVPRTLETALAMGFAVDDAVDLGGGLWEAAQVEFAHRVQRDNSQLYARYMRLIDADGAVATLGRRQVELWHTLISRIPEGAQALLISHGGLIEPGLVATLPDWPHTRWGRGFRHGEGVRLRHDGTRFFDADILFLDGETTPVPIANLD
jgi:broad specificity phosphatase PhoE